MRYEWGQRTLIAVALETVLWWALMVGVWELTLSGTTLAEIYCEVPAAFIAAVAAVVARRTVGGSWRPSLSWVRWLPVLGVSVLADTGRVLALAARHLRDREPEGDFEAIQLLVPTAALAETHRAYAALVVTSTPGSMVYDAVPSNHQLLVHSLVSGPPNLREVVAR